MWAEPDARRPRRSLLGHPPEDTQKLSPETPTILLDTPRPPHRRPRRPPKRPPPPTGGGLLR
eukprot:14237501-Alexandrium_andersonii.AAC.1